MSMTLDRPTDRAEQIRQAALRREEARREHARARVSAGAAFLDAHRAGWRDRLLDALEERPLNMRDCTECVVGTLLADELGEDQVHHFSWSAMLHKMGVYGDAIRAARELGFDQGADVDVSYNDLEAAWLDEILGDA